MKEISTYSNLKIFNPLFNPFHNSNNYMQKSTLLNERKKYVNVTKSFRFLSDQFKSITNGSPHPKGAFCRRMDI